MDKSTQRFAEIDIAKGIAVVLMLFGHSELFLNTNAYFPRALEDDQYLPIERLYNFLLYIFQSSVDGFYFFAGVGLALAARRSDRIDGLRIKIFKRSLFLIFLDLTLISWAYGRSLTNWEIVFGSIGTFGVSFLIMNFLLRWRTISVFILALVIFILREIVVLREPLEPDSLYGVFYGVFWAPLYAEHWTTLFTVLCWLPVIMLGFCFGRLIVTSPKALSSQYSFLACVSLLVIFAGFRLFLPFGSLGQPLPKTFLQILQLDKYPASIHFHLMNLGFAFLYLFIAVACLNRPPFTKLRNILILFGRQMLFVYVAHLIFLAILKYTHFQSFVHNSDLATYLGFFLLLGCLIPLTKYYDKVKHEWGARIWLLNYL